jgi:hypothetical protein
MDLNLNSITILVVFGYVTLAWMKPFHRAMLQSWTSCGGWVLWPSLGLVFSSLNRTILLGLLVYCV